MKKIISILIIPTQIIFSYDTEIKFSICTNDGTKCYYNVKPIDIYKGCMKFKYQAIDGKIKNEKVCDYTFLNKH